MIAEARAGIVVSADGNVNPVRADRTGAMVVTDGHARYQEATLRQNLFSMVLGATTTGVAAGQIVAAAAAASTNFALFNPVGSGKNLVLIKFGLGIISGTPGAGPLFHGFIVGVPTVATTGTILNNFLNGPGSVAKGWATAAGTALTGGGAPTTHSMADFTSTGTAQASVGELKAIEYIDGAIIIPPGLGWLPLWGAAGTTLLNGYSITWEEVAV